MLDWSAQARGRTGLCCELYLPAHVMRQTQERQNDVLLMLFANRSDTRIESTFRPEIAILEIGKDSCFQNHGGGARLSAHILHAQGTFALEKRPCL